LHQKSKKLTRWTQEIEEWGCKIIHCPGRENVVADKLSRAPVEPVPNEPDHLAGDRDIYIPLLSLTYYDNLLSSIRDAQKEDEFVQDIVKTCQVSVLSGPAGRLTSDLTGFLLGPMDLGCRPRWQLPCG